MNVVLWILQGVLALLSFAGGAYKVFAFDELAKMPATAALPRGAWAALGCFEMVCGVLLLVPGVSKRVRGLAAAAVAVESLILAAIYARYSLDVAATNPLVWVVIMTLIAVVIAYGRLASFSRTR